MAYLNNIYGNAAYTGFIAGTLEGRQITSTTSANYDALKTSALAFAEAVDSTIVFDALVSTGSNITQLAQTTNTISANEQWRAGLLHDLCMGLLSGRSVPSSLLEADWAGEAAAIFTAWTNLVAGLVTP